MHNKVKKGLILLKTYFAIVTKMIDNLEVQHTLPYKQNLVIHWSEQNQSTPGTMNANESNKETLWSNQNPNAP